MTFLDKDAHEKWVKEKLPALKNKLYGFKEGEYTSDVSIIKSGEFPILDTVFNKTNHLSFRAIVKLTYDERDTSYQPSEAELETEAINGGTLQVLIIRVDKDLNIIDKGHYPLTTIQVS